MQSNLTLAQSSKDEGNICLKANEFDRAIQFYTKSIRLAQQNQSMIPKQKLAIYYANRAFAHIKLENYGLSIPDSQESIKLNPKYEKAYLRLSFVHEILQHYKQAYNSYKKLFELSGNKDQTIYAKLINCKQLNQQQLKNRKIELLHDDQQRKNNSLLTPKYKDWKEIQVQKSYQGLHLKVDQIPTKQWMIKLMQQYKNQKTLHKRYTLQLIQQCKNILKQLKTIHSLELLDQQQITICGDIHGQYYDVFNLMHNLNGYPQKQSNIYLFNGDFVDRGSFSVQCIMTLIGWKCVNSDCIHMIRGNHQAKQVNMVYGFKGEVQSKFKDNGVYQAFSELFCALPLSYVINQKIMICHGGLPVQDNVTIQQIRDINRFVQPPNEGIMCDLLWADPINTNGRQPSKRGVSMGFGPDITNKFLSMNNLTTLIRSHEAKQQGYQQIHQGKCITIFSAPNYCDFQGNKGAYIKLTGKNMKPKFIQFNAVDHPKIGPMAYANQFRGMI